MNPLEVMVFDEEGKEVSLREVLGGKWTVLYVYPKDNTPGCTTTSSCHFTSPCVIIILHI